MPNTVTYPPLSLKTAKELWIFWYGEEPVWNDILVPELVKNTGELTEYFIFLQLSKLTYSFVSILS